MIICKKWTDYEIKVLYLCKFLLNKKFQYSFIEEMFMNDVRCENRTSEAIRKKFNEIEITDIEGFEIESIKAELLSLIKKTPYTLDEYSDMLELPIPIIRYFINEFRDSNIPINIIESGHVVYNKSNFVAVQDTDNVNSCKIEVENPNDILFGVVSDTHFGSKSCEMEKLNYFYDYCKSKNIKTILHAGDLVDGIKVYKGQEYEQTYYGFQSQCDSVIKNYPKIEGIKTYAILGNHDYSFISLCDSDPFDKICMYRSDIIYAGKYFGEVQIGNFTLAMHHPDAGQAYALTYKMQKILESTKKFYDGYIIGHYHSSVSLFNYHSNWSCLAGSFQNETMFSRRKGLRNTIGGFVVRMIKKPDKTIIVEPSWIDCSRI